MFTYLLGNTAGSIVSDSLGVVVSVIAIVFYVKYTRLVKRG